MKTETIISNAVYKARENYCKTHPNSLKLFNDACSVFPGGNTRSSLYWSPFPLTMQKGIGCSLWDVDGYEYLDFLGDYTAGLFGHSNSVIQKEILSALQQGLNLGSHNIYEAKFAKLICNRFPSIELVRFTNSGTEANLLALTTACGITKRKKIIVFEGAFHGSLLNFTHSKKKSLYSFEFIVGKYNDKENFISIIKKNKNEIAAVLIEPMQGASGCIPADKSFLEIIRGVTKKNKIILIFDEVMTSRLSFGGLQKFYDIKPDMTTLGKYVAGGMTFGAFGGRKDIMSYLDLRKVGAFNHSGTFNNNVLSMAAGYAALSIYSSEVAYKHNLKGDAFREKLNKLTSKKKVNICFTGIGSMLNMHISAQSIRNVSAKKNENLLLRELIFYDFLSHGILIGSTGFISLSLLIKNKECNSFIDIFSSIIDKNASFV